MLSGRGIDGELKSKFGEWSEKFWKSSSWGSPIQAKNFQAIYLANGEGGSGQALSTLKRDNGKSLISTGSGGGDQVESAFGFCVGGGKGNDCKGNNNNSSVVLVGDDPNVNASMTWEKLKSQDWGDQASLVRSGKSYDGLFKGKIWKGHNKITGSSLNRPKLQDFIKNYKKTETMATIFCPWVSALQEGKFPNLARFCRGKSGTRADYSNNGLVKFLNSDSAKAYFRSDNWTGYGEGWKGLAFLVLAYLWTNDFNHVQFEQSSTIFNTEDDQFSLSSLIKPDNDVVFVENDSNQKSVASVTKYSKKEWTVLLRAKSEESGAGQSLSITLSNDQLCIQEFVCLTDSVLRQHTSTISRRLDGFGNYFKNLWMLIFKSRNNPWDFRKAFMALLTAAFNSPEDVVVSVQKPSEEGDLIFTHLK